MRAEAASKRRNTNSYRAKEVKEQLVSLRERHWSISAEGTTKI